MRLREALNVQRGDIVTFTGAGGKTSALFRLGQELAAEGWRVIGTTTTRIATSELALAPGEFQIDGPGRGFRPIRGHMGGTVGISIHALEMEPSSAARKNAFCYREHRVGTG